MTHRFRLRHAAVLGLATSVLAVSPALAKPDNGNGKAKAAVVDDGAGLRAAIDAANAAGTRTVISLDGGTYVLDAPGAGENANRTGDLDITGDVVIVGNGSTIDLGGYGDRAFDVLAGGSLSIDKLTIVDGTVSGPGASGGAISNAGDLRVDRSELLGNSAVRAGGAIEAVAGSTTTIDRTRLADNEAGPTPGNGGAVHITGAGDLVIDRSQVDDNTAAAEGGGLWNGTGTMTVSRTSFSGNAANGTAADNGGGALFNDGGTLVVDRSSIDGNRADQGSGSGGGIFNNAGTLDVSKTTITGNDAARAGGGIETLNGTTSVSKSTLSDNTTGPAPGNGGGLHASGNAATVSVDRTEVTGNTATLEGGGLWAGAGDSVMTVTRSNISGNTANGSAAINGGGGLFNKGGLLVVENSTVSDNHAAVGSGSGGGILNLGTLEVSDTEISGNSAARAGGGIESNAVNGAGDADLVRVELVDNTTGPTPGNGGGMHVTGGSITTLIDDSVVTGNDATNEGGGLWNFNGATMTVTDTVIVDNTAPIAPNVFQNGAGGNFTVDGVLVGPGDNALAFP